MINILEANKQKLIDASIKALDNPYAKDYKRIFTAAVLTTHGNIYSAISYYSDTYSLTLHGEQAALCHAACHGEGEILAIAICSNEDLSPSEFTNPCHMCKQLLWESQLRSGVNMQVILVHKTGEVKEIPLNEMISYPWPEEKK